MKEQNSSQKLSPATLVRRIVDYFRRPACVACMRKVPVVAEDGFCTDRCREEYHSSKAQTGWG